MADAKVKDVKASKKIDLDSDSLPPEFHYLHIIRSPTTLKTIAELETKLEDGKKQSKPQIFSGCVPLQPVAPQFRVPFRCSILLYNLAIPEPFDVDTAGIATSPGFYNDSQE